MEEIWDLVDEGGNPTGVLYRRTSGDPIPHGLYFAVVEIWLRVGDSVLLTQRHPDKWSGLMWEVSGGGVNRGERNTEAAVREFYEETGIRLSEGDISLLGSMIRKKAMIYSYYAELKEIPDVVLQPSEVVSSRWMNGSEIENFKPRLTSGTAERFELYRDKIFGKSKI